MADTQSGNDLARTDDAQGLNTGPPIRRRRGLRIALLSLASVFVLLGAVVAGGYAYVNHLAGSIQRVPVKFAALDVAGASGGMTILITGNQIGPTGATGAVAPSNPSGLIMLLHIDANQKAGGVVSIPPQTEVAVPGHGRMQLWDTLATGGPTLLVRTVQSVTGVPIDHYAQIDFDHVAAMINAVGGVTVTLPAATVSFGHVFHQGANQLTGTTALYYARQPSLTETGRVLRQQSLMRAVLNKLAADHLRTNPVVMYGVLKAMTAMLTVDSNFSNSQIESLATKLDALGAGGGTFVAAPTQATGGTLELAPESSQLWSAINHDSIATFAQRYPATLTPAAPK